MSKSKKKLPQLDKLISVAGFVIALVALFFSWQANKLAKEANDIAKQSNDIARETNKITLLDTNADLQAIRGSAVIPVSEYGCKSSSIFYVYSSADIYVTFTNNGGRSTSLIRVELPQTSWSVNAFDQNIELSLPAEIPSGISKRWHFVAHGLIGYGDSKDSIQYNQQERLSGSILNWTFFFGNGKTVTWETPSYYSSAGLNFDRDCAELGN